MTKTIVAFAALAAFSGTVMAGETLSNPEAQAYFVNLSDGDTV